MRRKRNPISSTKPIPDPFTLNPESNPPAAPVFFMENLDLKHRWWAFHRANPEVMDRFIQVAFELIKNGHKRYSSDGILHVIRYDLNKSRPNTNDQFVINNSWSAYMARYFIHLYPQHKDFFELRELKNETNKTDIPPSPQGIKNVLDRGRSLFPQPSVLGDPGGEQVQSAHAAPTPQKIALEKWLETNG